MDRSDSEGSGQSAGCSRAPARPPPPNTLDLDLCNRGMIFCSRRGHQCGDGGVSATMSMKREDLPPSWCSLGDRSPTMDCWNLYILIGSVNSVGVIQVCMSDVSSIVVYIVVPFR
jgi:hypothetical protein